MTPTLDQLKQLIADVDALNDPEVRITAPGVFGSQADPGTRGPFVDPVGMEVDIAIRGDELTYRVTRWWPAPQSTNPSIRMGGYCRWIYARPAWGCKADLPDLTTAVKMQRLQNTDFPKPEAHVTGEKFDGNVHYLNSDDVVIGVRMPLWRLLQALGVL